MPRNALLLLVGLCLSAPANATSRPFTSEDLVRMERVGAPVVSPNAREVAYTLRETDLAGNRGVTRLWILDLRSGKSRPLTAEGSSVYSPRWSHRGHALYFLSARSGSMQVWRLDLRGGEPLQATDLPLGVVDFAVVPGGERLVVALEVFPDCEDPVPCTVERLDAITDSQRSGVVYDRLFVRHWDSWKDGRRNQLFALALDDIGLASGEPLALTAGLDADAPSKPFGDAGELSFSPDGEHLYFPARVAGAEEAWSTNFDLYRVPTDASAAPINLTAGNPAVDTAPRVSPNGKYLAWLAMSRPGFEADRLRVMVRELPDGEPREVAPDWDHSPHGLAWGPDNRTLFANAASVGNEPLFAIDSRNGRVRTLTGAGTVNAFDVAGKNLVLSQDAFDRPAELWQVPQRGGKLRRLTSHTQERLAELQFGEYEPFDFTGANGDTVHGWIVAPTDFDPDRRYPVAFLIHGGPQGSFGNHFHYRWNPQTYAGAGYVAVVIDFHGSTGYGQAFTDSISGDWGGKPLEDLKKGWAHVRDSYAFVDPRRVCALGASYGGYMVNWIASQWQQPFDCLVNHDGLFDLRSFYYSTEELWFPEWEFGGPYHATPETYERFNPARHVTDWKLPMLVIHGSADHRVPLEQGLAAFTALQRQGIPSRFLHFPDENHFVLKPHNSLQWHETVEAWLDRWIGPGRERSNTP